MTDPITDDQIELLAQTIADKPATQWTDTNKIILSLIDRVKSERETAVRDCIARLLTTRDEHRRSAAILAGRLEALLPQVKP